jgi:hypothetical protein
VEEKGRRAACGEADAGALLGLAELGQKAEREKNSFSFSFHNISKHFQMKF